MALRVSGTAGRRVRRVANEHGELVLATDAASEARRSWHVAADWCEAFGPVIYAEVDARLRAQVLEQRVRLDAVRDAGQPLDRPQVVLLDEVPVHGRTLERCKRSRRDDGFWLLVLAEMRWPPASDDPFVLPTAPRIAVRLVRAMSKANTPAWRLVFDELGYGPDFVVADAATSIASAIREHDDPSRTRFIPSLWHLTRAVEADLLRTQRLPVEKALGHRARYEPTMTAALAVAPPDVHLSTGGLEALIDSQVKRLLAPRRTALGNIERTNILLDLVVARQHDVFDNLGATAALIRDDALAHDGYTVPLRSVADPRPPGGSYSSLRDVTLLSEAARRKGLL